MSKYMTLHDLARSLNALATDAEKRDGHASPEVEAVRNLAHAMSALINEPAKDGDIKRALAAAGTLSRPTTVRDLTLATVAPTTVGYMIMWRMPNPDRPQADGWRPLIDKHTGCAVTYDTHDDAHDHMDVIQEGDPALRYAVAALVVTLPAEGQHHCPGCGVIPDQGQTMQQAHVGLINCPVADARGWR